MSMRGSLLQIRVTRTVPRAIHNALPLYRRFSTATDSPPVTGTNRAFSRAA